MMLANRLHVVTWFWEGPLSPISGVPRVRLPVGRQALPSVTQPPLRLYEYAAQAAWGSAPSRACAGIEL
jgi:hypothetical protein